MLFGSYAEYYDPLYQEKDYIGEVQFLQKIANFSKGITILDLGSGTGGHDIPLAKGGFQVTGVDLSEQMISLAKHKAAEQRIDVTFLQGDIRSIRLGTTFGLVISMFAVMGYQVQNDDFYSAMCTARAHLKQGGMFIFDAWYGPAVLANRPATRVKEIATDNGRVIRIAVPELNTFENSVTVHYKVLRLRENQVLDRTEEAHPMRFFFAPEVAFFARQAGFEITKVCPLMDASKQPGEQDWNVTWVLRAS